MISSYDAASPSSPLPRLTARSILSAGTDNRLAPEMASARRGLPAGSPPPVLAATSMVLISLANSLPRLASIAPFLCLVVAHLECPLTSPSPSPVVRTARGRGRRRSAPGGTRSPARCPAGRTAPPHG